MLEEDTSNIVVKFGGVESLNDYYDVLSDAADDRPVIIDQPFQGREEAEDFFDDLYTIEYNSGRIEDQGPHRHLLSTPADLTGRGIAVSEVLEHVTRNYEREPLLISEKEGMVDQYVGNKKHFRFLHTLSGKISAIGATGVYGFHDSMDENTYNTYRILADAEIDMTSPDYDI